MKMIAGRLSRVVLIEPELHNDERGFFVEAFHEARYRASGVEGLFVQDNHSRSRRGVLRGLHFQRRRPQEKLVWVARGAVYDVVVDLRAGSATFGRWEAVTLSDEHYRQLYVPAGFAHGFCVLSEHADFVYKCTNYYDSNDEGGIAWNDPDLAISWPVSAPLLSDKDRALPPLRALGKEDLPCYEGA